MEIELQGVTKLFGPNPALFQVTASAGATDVVLLAGPNGSGKSTMLRLMAGVLLPTNGYVLADGRDITTPEYRDRVGYLPQRPLFYEHMTPVGWLQYLACLKALPPRLVQNRITELVDSLALHTAAHTQIGLLSSGMRQRLAIASAFLNDPDVVLLDEPLTNLDPETRLTLLDWLSMHLPGRLCVIASHMLAGFTDLAQRLWLLHTGVLKADLTISEAMHRVQGLVWQVTTHGSSQQPLYGHVVGCRRVGEYSEWRVLSKVQPPGAVAASSTLDDAYLYLITENPV